MSSDDNKSNVHESAMTTDDTEVHPVRHPLFEDNPPEVERLIRERVAPLLRSIAMSNQMIDELRRENEALRARIVAATPAPGRFTVPPMTPSVPLAVPRATGSMTSASPMTGPYVNPSPTAPTSAVPGSNTTTAGSSSSSSSCPKNVKYEWPDAFSGIAKQGPTFRHWGYGMTNIMAVRNVSLSDDVDTSGAIREAATRLTDSALEWYNDSWLPLAATMEQVGVKPKWSQFMAHLQAVFEPLPPSFIARTELKSLRQTGGLADYIHQFRLLSSRIPDMAEADRVERFIDGLKPALAAKVTIAMCEDLITATAIAVKLEASYQALQANRPHGARQAFAGRGRQFNLPNAPARPGVAPVAPMELGQVATQDDFDGDDVSTQSLAAIQPHQRSAIPKMTDALKADLAAQGKCYRCRQKGHIARNCTFFDRKNE